MKRSRHGFAMGRLIAACGAFAAFAVFGGVAACGGSSGGPEVVGEAISPERGPLAGGNEIVITGSGFINGGATPNQVLIGDRMSAAVQVVDDRTLVAVVPPAEAPGTVDVTVYNSRGFASLAGAYEYNPLPTITAIDPNTIDRLGGETVTINGTGFADREPGQTTLRVGDVEIDDLAIVSDTRVTFTTPPGTPFSVVDIALTNANGEVLLEQAVQFTKPGLLAATTKVANDILFHFIDVETGEVIPIPKADQSVFTEGYTGLARAPDGRLLGVTRFPTNSLFELDLRGSQTELFSFSDRFADLAFIDDTLFAIGRLTQRLVTIDPATGDIADIGAVSTSTGSGLTSTSDGRLFMGRSSQLQIINSQTANVEQVIGFMPDQVGALAMLNGELYGAFPRLDMVARIDQATADVTPIAFIDHVDALETLP